jgi:protein phosphatase
MRFKFGLKSDIGRRRTENQDSGCARPDLKLFIVADGMGGHRGGQVASSIATEMIPNYIETRKKNRNSLPLSSLISESIHSANLAILERSQEDIELQGMGTTTTTLAFDQGRAWIGHVGDSRCYLIRDGHIWQLTRDHSLVQEKLKAGLINRNELKTDRMKNIITRSVGFSTDLQVDLYQRECDAGDIYLICSDGLSGPLSDTEILSCVERNKNEPTFDRALEELIASANETAGDDNITVILVQIESL